MATTFLVVKVLSLDAPQGSTIGYAPLDIPAKFVLAGFGGPAGTPMGATKDLGVFELPVPAGTKSIEVAVKDAGKTLDVGGDTFWAMSQKLTLEASTPPTLKFDGTPHVNVSHLDNHSRGSDFSVEVFVVLGHLRDGFPVWSSVADVDFSFSSANIVHFSTPVLNPGGKGLDRFNQKFNSVLPQGDILFAEQPFVPKMIVIYRPKQFVNLKYPVDRPYPYHIFFHPHPPWTDPYPDGFGYADMAQRYLLTALRRVPAGVKDQGKHMVHQQFDGGDKMILVFPVGSNKEGFEFLTTQKQTFRLLQEINYWSQRIDFKLHPLAPIGQVALSGFSFGITAAATIVMSTRYTLLFDNLLKEFYNFDGVFQEPVLGKDGKPLKNKDGSPKTQESPKLTAEFCDVLKTWFKQGGRSIRVYTQRSYWFDSLASLGGTLTTGPDDAKELESPSVTLLLAPAKFWGAVLPGITSSQVHQEIPARFLEHAIDRSPLPPGPPSAPSNPAGPLTVKTLTPLTSGLVNNPYPNTTLEADGGRPPLKWVIKSGNLPPGLNLAENGVISGKPTAEGHFSFVVEVTDDLLQTAVKGLDIDIQSRLCFIISAAHGSPFSPEVNFLWSLREKVLRPTEWGRQFFDEYWRHYYRISPGIAEQMNRDPALRKTVRWSIVEPWTNYMKLLLARPDWDKVDFASLDPAVREFLQEARNGMERWVSEIELPVSFAGRDAAEAVKELNVALTYVVRTGGRQYLEKLRESGELPLRFEESRREELRRMLVEGGRDDAEIECILGAGVS